jgi:pilus assembly protein TadC
MTILIAFLGALGFSLLLSAALFPFEKLMTAAPASQSPLDRADAISGEGTARSKEVTIFNDKPILDRILSPWIVELTRRIKPQQKADVEDRLRRAGYPYQTAGDYYGTKLVNGFLGFVVGLVVIIVVFRAPALIFIPIAMAVLGVVSPDQQISEALKKRQELLFAEMAFTLDRLATLNEAGLSLLAALKELCGRPGGLFITEVRISLDKVGVGKTPREAMEEMLERLPEMDEAHTFFEKAMLGIEQARPVASALRAMGHRMQRKVEADMLARGMRKLLLITGIGIGTLIPAAMLIMATMPLMQAVQMLAGG